MINLLLKLAAIPPLVLVFMVYRADRVEREPLGLIVKLLVLGGVSTFVAGLLEDLLSFTYSHVDSHIAAGLIHYFLVVAVVEECCKYLILRKITWNHPAFNYTFDGIVYAVAVSLGFALVENMMYAVMFGFKTVIIRAFTAVVLHGACGVFMGMSYGQAGKLRSEGRHDEAGAMRVKGLGTAVLIHGTYDFCAVAESGIALAVFFILLAVIYVEALRNLKKSQKQDQNIR